MSSINHGAAAGGGLPPIVARLIPDARTVRDLCLGGAGGLLAWELFARLLTPEVIGGPLEPASLIISLFQNLFGFDPGRPAAEALHYVTGIAGYPLAYWVLARLTRSLGPTLDGVLWGVATWFMALGLFASLAGLPFMLGFIPLSWMSLVGHMLYAMVAVSIFFELRQRG
ncbi:MAG: hypothetical protein RLO51_13765 [Thalassobaculum sp.]|uniref:hypothetical protein n=1 Tax=Thalassobaculum sp. TaxID=2022740 RepID=UPI0032EB5FF6